MRGRVIAFKIYFTIFDFETMTILIIVEDGGWENFLPLTYMRPIFELRTGLYTLRERMERALRKVIDVSDRVIVVRRYLRAVLARNLKEYKVNLLDSVDEDAYVVNGRLLMVDEFVKELTTIGKDESLFDEDGSLLVAHISKETLKTLEDPIVDADVKALNYRIRRYTARREVKLKLLLKYPWELIVNNAKLLSEDIESLKVESIELPEDVKVIGDIQRLKVARGVKIEPYVVFDVSHGPIYVEEGCIIQAFARIEGPAYIGKRTYIMSGASVREGANIGPVCRIGGEVECSIFHGYSNKYHYGFIGHAYICEWVNIGAGTTNSDLKNTYGTVKVTVKGKRVDTGLIKIGCFIGDMVKTSIGTLIYTGKKIGLASHLHGIITRDVPSFTIWFGSLTEYKAYEAYLDSILETQRRMMLRRDKLLSREEEELIRLLFKMTENERKLYGVKKGRVKL